MPVTAMQDGNTFYVYSKDENHVYTIHAPSHIRVNGDFDVAGANKALEWFKQTYPEITIE